jgi:hypothetical protein
MARPWMTSQVRSLGPQVLGKKSVTAGRIACPLLDGYWIQRHRGWRDSAPNPCGHRYLGRMRVLDGYLIAGGSGVVR